VKMRRIRRPLAQGARGRRPTDLGAPSVKPMKTARASGSLVMAPQVTTVRPSFPHGFPSFGSPVVDAAEGSSPSSRRGSVCDEEPRGRNRDDARFSHDESSLCFDTSAVVRDDATTHIKEARDGNMVWHERDILLDVAHPSIIPLRGTNREGTELYIDLGHHDLYDHIADSPGHKLDVAEVLSIAHGMSDAVSHLHRRRYAHNDIKAENIVMCHRPFEDNEWRPKLIDFEFAHLVSEKPPEGEGMVAGTGAYYSPEKEADAQDPSFTSDAYCRQAADCWALGVTLHLAAFGRFPNGTGNPEPILEADFKAPEGTDPHVATLLEGLLTVDVSDRWTAKEAHAYLADVREVAAESDAPQLLDPGFAMGYNTISFT